MRVSEAFLVNTKNFASIIDTLVKHQAKEPVIDSVLFENLCFSDPNDLLVICILKDFKIIDNDGKPSLFFDEFKNPETTNIVLAKGLITAYEGLFEAYPKIYQAPIEKIKTIFEEIFQGKKTELIIKYISGTFQKVVSHVGVPTIDNVLKEQETKIALAPSAVEAESIPSNNGQPLTPNVDQPIQKGELADDSIDVLLQDFGIEESQDYRVSEENKSDVTVREFLNEGFEDENETENQIEDDPFGLKRIGGEAEPPEIKTESTSKIDINPVNLDISLSTATQTTNSIEQLTAEHEFVQKALLRKSDLLQRMNRWEDLIPTLEEIIKRYDNKEHKGLQDVVSRSVIRQATALLKLNKTDTRIKRCYFAIQKL